MTENIEYAPEGYRFFQVMTPDTFEEYMLPEDWSDLTNSEARRANRLEVLADLHGTHIANSGYRKG